MSHLDIGAKTQRDLTTGPRAVEVLGEAVRDQVGRTLDDLVTSALRGNAPAVKTLAQKFDEITTHLIASLQPLKETVRPGLTELRLHLAKLPYLATVADQPTLGLYQWSLILLREISSSPVAYPRRHVDDDTFVPFELAVLGTLLDTQNPTVTIKRILRVSNEDIGRWLDVSPQAVSAWARNSSTPKADAAARLHRVLRLAEVFDEYIVAERIAGIFEGTPVPLLAGKTYRRALDDGMHPDVCIDVLRRAFGLPAETEAGARYLDGPDAPAAAALQAHLAASEAEAAAAPAGSAAQDDRVTAPRPRARPAKKATARSVTTGTATAVSPIATRARKAAARAASAPDKQRASAAAVRTKGLTRVPDAAELPNTR